MDPATDTKNCGTVPFAPPWASRARPVGGKFGFLPGRRPGFVSPALCRELASAPALQGTWEDACGIVWHVHTAVFHISHFLTHTASVGLVEPVNRCFGGFSGRH